MDNRGGALRRTMIEKFGSEEAWKEHMRTIGQKGGKNGKTGGWASMKVGRDGMTGPERSSFYGRIGGLRRKENMNAR